jgi:hypothetical protein
MNMEFYHPGDPVADILFNWSPLIAVALVCAFGGILMSLGFRAYVRAARLKASGVPGQAKIIAKGLKKGYVDREERQRSAPTKYHFLLYERQDNGRTYRHKEVAPLDLWDRLNEGDMVEIIYLPGRPLMRLAGWSDMVGHGGGMAQMALGGLMTSVAAGMLISGALSAMSGPEFREKGAEWIADQAEVLALGQPADGYLRLFAPDIRYVRVVFGDTQGGALMANQRLILLTPEQHAGTDIREGAILKAWIDPANAYNAILDLERDRSN